MIRIAIFFVLNILVGTLPNYLLAHEVYNHMVSSSYIQNQGQWSPEVLFLTQVHGMNVWLTQKGLMYDVYQQSKESIGSNKYRRQGQVIEMELVSANIRTASIGTDVLLSTRNYFIGNNPSLWRTNILAFGKVIVRDVYPGIDAVYTFSGGKPRYDFVIHPGAQPEAILLRFTGADAVKVSKDKGVELSTSVGTVINGNILAYQEINGQEIPVQCSFAQQGDLVKFDVGVYNSNHPLIIDPLVYSTYYGGTGIDEITGMKLDTAGNVVVTGVTDSPDFKTAVGSYDVTANGQTDAFVAKFDKTLSTLLFATYIGGGSEDKANGVAIDVVSSSIFIAGETTSSNMPTTSGAWKPSYSGGVDAFVARLSKDGSKLEYCTYIGGSKDDRALGICVEDAGKAAICGETNSIDYPTSGASAYQSISSGRYEGFITKLKPTGSGVEFSTFLGGSGDDRINGIDCDRSGTYICFGGETSGGFSNTFPNGINYGFCYNGRFNLSGKYDGFVGRMSGAGSIVEYLKHYLTFIGDSGNDRVKSVVMLPTTEVAVAGETEGGAGTKGFPSSSGSSESNGGIDCFVTIFNSQGSGLTGSYLFGGSGNESVVNMSYSLNTNELFVVGNTNSVNFPKSIGSNIPPERDVLAGVNDGFVCRLSTNLNQLSYSTYYGGKGEDGIRTVAATPRGDVYFAGYTLSEDVPVVKDGFQTQTGGGRDGFISKIAFGSVALTSPNGGAVYCPGSSVAIAWTKGEGLQSTENVNVELSSDGGATWTTVASNISGTIYSWKIPASQSSGSGYKIRILHPASGIRDESDASFSIGSSAEITEQPVGDSVCAGERAVFRVKGTGTNLTYKWLHNDIEIKGETRDSLVFGTVDEKDGGSYRVEVSAGCAPTVSQAVILSIMPKTKITNQQIGGIYTEGSPIVFTVTASGQNLSYEWQKDRVPIQGAITSEYDGGVANLEKSGKYRVVVRAECGADTSTEAILQVVPSGVIELSDNDEEIRIVPSPISDIMVVLGITEGTRLEIVNTLGIKIIEQTINSDKYEIDMNIVIDGIYIIKIQNGNQIFCKKIIVTH